MDLSKLNKEQKEAVTFGEGPLLIVAGAGTGKTTVLTHRIAYLIAEKDIKPEEILAVTFTEKAAKEMEDRVEALLPFGYYDLWVSTFHSFCDRILKNHGISIGLPTNYKLVDSTGSWVLVRKNFDKFNFLKEYRPLGNPTKFIHALISHFNHCKNEGIYPKDYLEHADSLKFNLDDIPVASKDDLSKQKEYERIKEIAQAYHTYQKLLLDNSVLDFGDLINYTLKLFEKRPDILEKMRNQFKYIMVDEFQDTNWVQYELIKKLAEPRNNITVVGDDDQSIFSFQGSSFNNVLRFKKDYPESEEIVLTNNYRSPQNILDLSHFFIQNNNPNRLEFRLNEVEELKKQAEEKGVDLSKIKKIDKKLKSQKKKDGMVGVLAYETGDDEIRGIISKIWEIKEIDKKAKFSDFAILTRTNETANNFSRALERAGIPYQFLSSKGLYTNPLILDFISYFNLLMNFYDSASFYRVLRMHPFDFSVEELAKITYFAEEKGLPISEVLNQVQLLTTLSKESREKVENLVKNIKKHFQISKEKNIGEVFVSMINDLGFIDHFSKNNEEDFKIWDIIDQFYHRIREFEDSHFDAKLISFVEHIRMEMEAGEEGSLNFDLEDSFDSVKIMTIHSAKGLEFDYVFLVNLVHRKFPTDEKREPIEIPNELIKEVLPSGDFHLQEERRLFYVGLTRARKGLFLAWALDYGGKTLKKPSRFLIESNLIHEEALNKQKFSRSSSFCFSRGNNNGFKKESKETENINGIKKYLPDHFSFSQIASFNNCPLQYKFSHLLKIPAKGRPNFSFGKTIHNTLYHFTKIAAKGLKTEQETLFGKGKISIPSFNDLIDVYKKEWIDEWYDETLRKEYFDKGKECLKLFYDNFVEKKPDILMINNEPALEKVFELKLNGDAFVGAIDRIDKIEKNEVEIIDYKTGVAKTSLGTDEKLQLLIYQLAAKKIFNLNATKLTYYYLDDGSTYSFSPKAEEIEKTEEKIREVIKRIKRSNFKPAPGWHCQYCDYRNICPHRKSGN